MSAGEMFERGCPFGNLRNVGKAPRDVYGGVRASWVAIRLSGISFICHSPHKSNSAISSKLQLRILAPTHLGPRLLPVLLPPPT